MRSDFEGESPEDRNQPIDHQLEAKMQETNLPRHTLGDLLGGGIRPEWQRQRTKERRWARHRGPLTACFAALLGITGCGAPADFEDFGALEQDIVGGVDAAEGAWPSAVAFRHSSTLGVVCGGSLVHPKWVLTAAHCLPLSGVIDVVIGRTELSSAGGAVRKVVKAFQHELYNPITDEYDVALVELDAPVAYRSIEGLTRGEMVAASPGDMLTAIGWGFGSRYPIGVVPPLQQVDLPFQGVGADCDEYWAEGLASEARACIGFVNGSKDTCPGDSGGPVSGRVAGMWKEFAVTSLGECPWSVPGLYTVASAASEFLRSKLPAAEGRMFVMESNGAGTTTAKSKLANLSSRWDILVPGQFASTAHADVLTYDSGIGQLRLYTSNGTGGVTAQSVQSGFSPYFTLLEAAKINADAFDDLVAYDPVAGTLRVYRNSGTGRFSAFGSARTDVGQAVQNMVVGNFDGDALVDVLLYTQNTGLGKVYEITGTGSISLIKTNTWTTGWEIIRGGDFSPSATTDLMFFAPSTGVAKFYRTTAGGLGAKLKEHSWNKDWQYIVPGQFGGTSYTDLFFYNPLTGTTKTLSTDGAGNTRLLKESTWGETWLRIVAGNFSGTSASDLVIYDRWVRPAGTPTPDEG